MAGSANTDDLMVFTGNANPELSRAVARYLDIPLGIASVGTFSDGETAVEIGENVRGRDVFANMLSSVGVDRVLTVDLHADQIQGFFECLVDNVYASPILMGDIWKQKHPDMIVVSPDVGGVVRARAVAKQLDDADLAIIDKRRPQPNMAKVMNIIGEVDGKTCIIVDDMVDTAGTLCQAGAALKERGAKGVYAYCTHPVLSGKAIENVENSVLDALVVTDTIPLSAAAVQCSKIRQVSVAEMLAETIRRVHFEESVSSLYMD